jgi:hypothetical protein
MTARFMEAGLFFLNGALFTPFFHSNPMHTGIRLSIYLDLAIGIGDALNLSRTLPVASGLRLKFPFRYSL